MNGAGIVIGVVSGGAIVLALLLWVWMLEIPVFKTLRVWKWRIREWSRSQPKSIRFTFPNGIELRYSATLYDDPDDREMFNSLCISFRLFRAEEEHNVGFCGGGSLFETIWQYESLAGPMPAVLVKSGGFVIVEGERCGQFLVLIDKAYCPRDVKVSAHQILVPRDEKEKPRELPMPDGRVLRVIRTPGEDTPWLELVDHSGTSMMVPADSPREMGKFHHALVEPTETARTTISSSSSPSQTLQPDA